MVDGLRRRILTAGLSCAALAALPFRHQASAAVPPDGWMDYVVPEWFHNLPFGAHSHYMQPWRAYRRTVRTQEFLDGIGAVVTRETPDAAIEMLARGGFVHARIEIGWGAIDFKDEGKLDPSHDVGNVERVLRACARNGLRPLMLLNSHQGLPCPTRFSTRTLTTAAAAGGRSIEVDDADGLIIGQSGLSNLTDFWAAEILVTGIDQKLLSLSKPLPRALPAGAPLTMATLKYEPFSVPGTSRNDSTILGWLRYVDTIRDFTAGVLGTRDAGDKGFDMEIWNELSFGTRFLSVNNYYDPPQLKYKDHHIWREIAMRTMGHVTSSGDGFSGIRFTNGFGSTVPWEASSVQPAGIVAISKHPYPPVREFPKDEQTNTRNLNAQSQVIRGVPAYRAWFPEHYATAIQTETMVRDMGPFDNDIYGLTHGRFARRIGGEIREVGVWLTEIGISPEDGGIVDRDAALRLKAKSAARFLTFFLNMGCERLYFFEANAPDTQLGIILQTFIEHAKSNTGYPSEEKEIQFLSPMLLMIKRLVRHMRERNDPTLSETRALDFQILRTRTSAELVPGLADEGVDPLRAADALTILTYQSGHGRFVIPFYVMTRDIRVDMAEENIPIRISGVKKDATLQIVDLLNDRIWPVTAHPTEPDFLMVSLPATDMPRLLIIEEN